MSEQTKIRFFDLDGNTLCIAPGKVDPTNYPPSKDFPQGWSWETITVEKAREIHPLPKVTYHESQEPPRKQISKLKDSYNELLFKHEALIDSIEDHLKLNRGDLRTSVDEKIKARK